MAWQVRLKVSQYEYGRTTAVVYPLSFPGQVVIMIGKAPDSQDPLHRHVRRALVWGWNGMLHHSEFWELTF